jgi:hypothetical protein
VVTISLDLPNAVLRYPTRKLFLSFRHCLKNTSNCDSSYKGKNKRKRAAVFIVYVGGDGKFKFGENVNILQWMTKVGHGKLMKEEANNCLKRMSFLADSIRTHLSHISIRRRTDSSP